ncbi:MAG: hypothetical protein ACOZCO_15940 [Bacteroidota bacterium]
MKIVYRSILSNSLLFLLLFSCNPSEKNSASSENTRPENKNEWISKLDCREIEKFPLLFSYATESLKKKLFEKCIQPLHGFRSPALAACRGRKLLCLHQAGLQ